MKILKLGGSLLTDSNAIKKLPNALKEYAGQNIIVIFSALYKITNALEDINEGFVRGDSRLALFGANNLLKFHLKIIDDLYSDDNKWSSASEEVVHSHIYFLDEILRKDPAGFKGKESYDAIVSLGEKMSTNIISRYLSSVGIENHAY